LCLDRVDNGCKLLDKCSQANCEKFGIVNCTVEFEPEQLKYGELQSFFVRTYGKSPNSSVDSNISSQRIELDRVKPENLKVTTSEKRIDVVIPEADKPRGSYSRIRIWCLVDCLVRVLTSGLAQAITLRCKRSWILITLSGGR